MIVQFRNEKVSNHGSIPITIDCNVVAFIVFEEGFHQPIKRTKQSVFLDLRSNDREQSLSSQPSQKLFQTHHPDEAPKPRLPDPIDHPITVMPPSRMKHFKTVIYNRWLHRKKYLETDSVENKPRPGGPSKLTSRAKRMTVKSGTNKPMTSAQNIANELLSSCNVSVSAQTVRKALHSAHLKARTPRKKPYISEVNRKRRLEFAMKYKNKPMDF
ncbi:hypothetical protein TNCV_2973231 [Trichonephila clavipes]|nr:hypothetical protein TNCV_2973231 [Trichonephila clavipes]